ncbi:hypothetical protein [Actinomadura monticuli]|uniref:Uncharacterized protein n=1 Tax=Actinomadura monticuli TaxID=3097367 RepID=A0ABV4QL58_9ACTN
MKESGKPHATVVYLGPVTADPSIKNKRIDLLAGVQGEADCPPGGAEPGSPPR